MHLFDAISLVFSNSAAAPHNAFACLSLSAVEHILTMQIVWGLVSRIQYTVHTYVTISGHLSRVDTINIQRP